MNAASRICMSFRSRRAPGTPAARMPQLARDVVKDRARRLREKGGCRIAAVISMRETGRTRRVLIELDAIGRTEHFTPVRVADTMVAGQHRRYADRRT